MPLNNHKPLYQPWNEEEFRSDMSVQEMDDMERWMYRTLLQSAFFCATRPYLPDDDRQLWRMAGCDSPKKWGKHKAKVIKMFQKFKDGNRKLLKQKRLEIDWQRERERRQMLSEKGLKGAEAKKAKALAEAQAQVQHGLSTEPNCTEPDRTEPNETEREADMSAFKDRICRLARKHLRVTIQTNDKDFSEMLARTRQFEGDGQMAVGDAFEAFCIEREGQAVDYPLRAFLARFDGYVEQSVSVQSSDNGHTKPVIDEMVKICDGAVRFEKKHQTIVGNFLQLFAPWEIIAAFKEFWGQVSGDDFQVRHAARVFTETLEQTVTLQRARREATRQQTETIRQLTEQERAKAEAELAEKLAEDAGEQDLVEDTLPEG